MSNVIDLTEDEEIPRVPGVSLVVDLTGDDDIESFIPGRRIALNNVPYPFERIMESEGQQNLALRVVHIREDYLRRSGRDYRQYENAVRSYSNSLEPRRELAADFNFWRQRRVEALSRWQSGLQTPIFYEQCMNINRMYFRALYLLLQFDMMAEEMFLSRLMRIVM